MVIRNVADFLCWIFMDIVSFMFVCVIYSSNYV